MMSLWQILSIAPCQDSISRLWPTLYHVVGLTCSCNLPCTFSLDKKQTPNKYNKYLKHPKAVCEFRFCCCYWWAFSQLCTRRWEFSFLAVKLEAGSHPKNLCDFCWAPTTVRNKCTKTVILMTVPVGWTELQMTPVLTETQTFLLPELGYTSSKILCGHLCPCCRGFGSQTGPMEQWKPQHVQPE